MGRKSLYVAIGKRMLCGRMRTIFSKKGSSKLYCTWKKRKTPVGKVKKAWDKKQKGGKSKSKRKRLRKRRYGGAEAVHLTEIAGGAKRRKRKSNRKKK